MNNKIRFLLVLGGFLSFAFPGAAEEIALSSGHPQSYVVKPGDTLWGISSQFLRNPRRWREIWGENSQIANPHRIYPGDRIVLRFRDGKPVLEVAGRRHGRNVKLSPKIREYQHDDVVAAIPLDVLQAFLSNPRVVGSEILNDAPYVVSSFEEHLANGSGQRIYVRGKLTPEETRYSIFRGGEVYREPGTQKILGYEALDVGEAMLVRGGDPATFEILSSTREVLNGDRLMPREDDRYPEFVPHMPAEGTVGTIISMVDGVSQIGQYWLVVVNLGSYHGIEAGHVFDIMQSNAVVRDPIIQERIANTAAIIGSSRDIKLPEEHVGDLMVIRSFQFVSYALVMSINAAAHVNDTVRSPLG